MRNRSSTLSSDARRLLNVLSVAARPLARVHAQEAAQITRGARAAVHELTTLQLIRTRDSNQERLLEVYHDRLREEVQRLLTPAERHEIDRRLFDTLRATHVTDSDWLHSLAVAVDDRAEALRYGILAAQRASQMLAFERAAELFQRCVEVSDEPAANGGWLFQQLALAYSNAGHGNKAAATYLHAASLVSIEQALIFERAAASHLLCVGRFDKGETLLHKVLTQLNLDTPSTDAGLFAALGWEHARLALRGLEFTPREANKIPFALLFGSELCGMLSIETAVYHPLRAAVFQARGLRLSLEGGDPKKVARALCAAALIACVSGSERSKQRADELLARAEAISRTIGSAQLRINIASARGACAYLTGRITECIDLCYQAEHLLRSSAVDSEYHHRFSLVAIRLDALQQVGEYRRAEIELQVYLKEAEATENINAQLHAAMVHAKADVIAGRTAQAIERLERQRALLPRQGFGLLHVLYMIGVFRLGAATGDTAWALGLTEEYWQAFQGSVVRRSQKYRLFVYSSHARLLLNRCARSGTGGSAKRLIAMHIKALERSPLPEARAELTRLRARLDALSGDTDAALRGFAASREQFAACGTRDEAARDSYAVGLLTGGEPGASLMSAALHTLGELGVSDPLRDVQAHLPELLRPS